jgi:hypothetical protein
LNDHRRTGLGRLGPDEHLAAVAALFEQAPDIVFEPLCMVAAEAHGVLVMQRASGTLATGGGKFEQFYLLLSHYRGDRLATAGDRLALERFLWTGAHKGGPFETDTLTLVEVDAEGSCVAAIIFDPDDRRAAFAEMFERSGRSDAAQCIPPAAVEANRAMNAHDLVRFRAANSRLRARTHSAKVEGSG